MWWTGGNLHGKLLTGEMMSTKCRPNGSVITLHYGEDSFVTCQEHVTTSLFHDV